MSKILQPQLVPSHAPALAKFLSGLLLEGTAILSGYIPCLNTVFPQKDSEDKGE